MEWTSCQTMLNPNGNVTTGRTLKLARFTSMLVWLMALLFVNSGLALGQESGTGSAYIAGSGNELEVWTLLDHRHDIQNGMISQHKSMSF